jgi:hypothetical protein
MDRWMDAGAKKIRITSANPSQQAKQLELFAFGGWTFILWGAVSEKMGGRGHALYTSKLPRVGNMRWPIF